MVTTYYRQHFLVVNRNCCYGWSFLAISPFVLPHLNEQAFLFEMFEGLRKRSDHSGTFKR